MTDSAHWVRVAADDDVQSPPWPIVDVGDQQVVLVRDGADVHALGATCPHLQAPLVRADVTDGHLACTRHWYEYRLADGGNVHPGEPAASLPVWPVRVVDGMVEVQARVSP